MCLNGVWGSVCSEFWDNNDASVVCKQLGYSPYGTYHLVHDNDTIGLLIITGAIGPSTVYYYSSTPAHNIVDLNCTGSEGTILDCPYNGVVGYSCSSSKDANIFCEGEQSCLHNF